MKPLFSVLHALLLPVELKKHQAEWTRDNMNALWLICFSGMALSIFGIFISSTEGGYLNCVFIITLCLAVAFLVIIRLFRDVISRNPIIMVYVVCTIIFGLDIFLETSMQQGAVFIFCVMQIALPVCYVDYPLRIFLYELAASAAFLIVDMDKRSGLILSLDIARIIMGLFCALIVYTFVIQRRNKLTDTAIVTEEEASRDALTGIFNRGSGERRISDLVLSDVRGTFILLDIDDFKHINDHYGHASGDEVLQAVAAVLAASFRATDVVMRMGGDEFIIYAIGMLNHDYAQKKMQEICESMHEIVLDEAAGDHVSISAGCIINNGTFHSYDSIYKATDQLLYKTKQQGKDGFSIG